MQQHPRHHPRSVWRPGGPVRHHSVRRVHESQERRGASGSAGHRRRAHRRRGPQAGAVCRNHQRRESGLSRLKVRLAPFFVARKTPPAPLLLLFRRTLYRFAPDTERGRECRAADSGIPVGAGPSRFRGEKPGNNRQS
ncbi:hypothetical protein SDC9_67520 [bioreactor metagenome]|uniref:Uncharacterized protein n=1 Tax=bioreactor metagenome TaxID=1076179 RepID=A0A644XYU2_9ZZZZ